MQPRKILVLTANPRDTSRLRLDQEVREITLGLQRAKHREIFRLEQRWAVRPRDLRQALLEVEPEIVHFSGHGSSGEGLALENNAGELKFVKPEALSELFELCKAYVKCVILNACYSESQARSIYQYIPNVIGMQREISDGAAIEFAVGFYDALGAGRAVADAYRFGCNAISLEGISDNRVPTLLANSSPNSQSLSDDWNNEAYVSLHLVQDVLEKAGIPRKGATSHWYPQFKLKKSGSSNKTSNRKYIADFYVRDYERDIEFLVKVKAANSKIDDVAKFQVKSYLQYSDIKYAVIIDPFRIELYKLNKNSLILISNIEIEDVNKLNFATNVFREVLDSLRNENDSNTYF